MGTKIQINSLEALERLIGNDNELEIELRNSIVQEFTKKHLKDLAKSELMDDLTRAVQSEVKAEFFKEVKEGNWGHVKTYFKPEQLNVIKEPMETILKQEFSKLIYEAIERQKVEETINTAVNNAVNLITNNLEPQILERRIEHLVNVRLKEKLGLK